MWHLPGANQATDQRLMVTTGWGGVGGGWGGGARGPSPGSARGGGNRFGGHRVLLQRAVVRSGLT